MESISLTTLAADQLDLARQASSGRSAYTVYGGRQDALRQTMLALAAGRSLAEHESPGEATLQVLHGHVRLSTASDTQDATAGDYLAIPPERHGLTAIDDAVVLLTVATQAGD